MKFDWFRAREREFKELQEKKGILNPWKQKEKLHANTVIRHSDNCFSVREYTPEDYKLNEYWNIKIADWLIEEEKYLVEAILREFGYAEAEEYAFGQFRKNETKEFFENICPCNYGCDCNLFCKKFLECKGEK